MSGRAWLSVVGLAVASAAVVTTASLLRDREPGSETALQPAVITAQARPDGPRRALLPDPVAASSPGRPSVAAIADAAPAVPEPVAASYMAGYPEAAEHETLYAVRAVLDDGSPLRDAIESMFTEALTLRVAVVNSQADLEDGWIDEGEARASAPLYRFEPASPATAAGDPAGLGHIAVGTDLPLRLALLANDAVLTSRRVQANERLVTFAVTRARVEAWLGSLAVQVQEQGSDRPIVGANVQLRMGSLNVPRTVPDQTTDRYGRVKVALFPARVLVYASAECYAAGVERLDVPAGGQVQAATISLTPRLVVSGRVLDRAGQPVAARVVAQRPPRAGDNEGRYVTDVVADETTGAFKIEGLPAGEFELVAASISGDERLDPAVLPVEVDTRYGSVRNLELSWIPAPKPPSPTDPAVDAWLGLR